MLIHHIPTFPQFFINALCLLVALIALWCGRALRKHPVVHGRLAPFVSPRLLMYCCDVGGVLLLFTVGVSLGSWFS